MDIIPIVSVVYGVAGPSQNITTAAGSVTSANPVSANAFLFSCTQSVYLKIGPAPLTAATDGTCVLVPANEIIAFSCQPTDSVAVIDFPGGPAGVANITPITTG